MEKKLDAEKKFLSKPHLFTGCIERFTQMTKRHVAFLLHKSNKGLKDTIEKLEYEYKGLPAEILLSADDFPELRLKDETQLVNDLRNGIDSDDKILIEKRKKAIIKLIETHKPIFEKIAEKLDPTGFCTDDLVQEGLISFTRSLDCKNYRDEKQSRVINYTLRLAFYKMEKYLYMKSHPLSVKDSPAEKLIMLQFILSEKTNENTTLDDLIEIVSHELEIDEDKALDLIIFYNNDYGNIKLKNLEGPANTPNLEIEKAELKKRIDEVLKRLPQRTETVVRLRTGYYPDDYIPSGLQKNSQYIEKRLNDEHTYDEIGRIFGITRERVRQIYIKGLNNLRRPRMSKHIEGYTTMKPMKKPDNTIKPSTETTSVKREYRTIIITAEKAGFKSESANIEFLNARKHYVVLNIDGSRVVAVTMFQYANFARISMGGLFYYLKKANIQPINGVSIRLGKSGKSSSLFLREEIDRAIAAERKARIKEKNAKKINFKSGNANIKLLKVKNYVYFLLEINGEKVWAISTKRYAKYRNIGSKLLKCRIIKENINPIADVSIKPEKKCKSCALYKRDEINPIIDKIKTENKEKLNKEKNAGKSKFESKAENVKFLKINKDGFFILEIDGTEVETSTKSQYAIYSRIGLSELMYQIKKENIQPIEGVTMKFGKIGKPSMLYKKTELDKVVMKIIMKKWIKG